MADKLQLISKHKLISIVILLGLCTGLIFGVAHALSFVQFEAESGTVSGSATKLSDTTASGGSMLLFNTTTGGTKVFTHPGVVFTKAEIDSWSTSSPEYSRLAGTCAGNVNPTSGTSCYTRSNPVVFGARIDCGTDPCDETEIRNDANELNRGFKDQSGFAKVQAVLWAADNNAARRTKAISYLDQLKTVTGFQWDYIEQYRLVGGWACTNYVQAAEILNYQDDQFKRFMRDVCYPMMDWGGNPNWHASFAESKLAIAAYLGDEALWTDAKRYFYERIKQSIYVSAYDGNKVNPMHSEDQPTSIKNSAGTNIGSTVPARIHTTTGTPNFSATNRHWGSNYAAQINSDYSVVNTSAIPAVDGMNAERMRDLGHVNMSYAAWVSGARTIKAQGETLEAHAYQRILKGWDYHAGRVLYYAQNGVMPIPQPMAKSSSDPDATGGGSRFQGYFAAKQFFGSATPQSILNMLQRSEVTTYAPAGANGIVGEAFAQ